VGVTCDIEDENAAHCVFEVGGDEAFEFLLPGSVPQLEAAGAALELDVLADEVHADGRLIHRRTTLKKS
jgi:hypothetical protein